VDANDGAAETLLVQTDLRRQIGERRLVPELTSQELSGGFELAPHTADAARPCPLPESVDHRAPDSPLGERLELDAPTCIEAAGRVDETEHPVLHQVSHVNRVRHGGGEPPGKRFHEGQAIHDSTAVG
jgi:hypothetical protein